jgi:hypothetical protein
MPRYKPAQKGLKLLPVDFDRQVLQPGSFEYALCYLVDHSSICLLSIPATRTMPQAHPLSILPF